MLETTPHTIILAVRDYELDFQGIVNNSVYFNYLEHARHVFLKEKNIDVNALFKDGKAAIVVTTTLQYKSPLQTGDTFEIQTTVSSLSIFKAVFKQKIVRKEDNKIILEAEIISAIIDINTKKPQAIDMLFF